MKLLLLLVVSYLLPAPPALLLVDMSGKNPLVTATDFSANDYLLRKFPLYAEDLDAVVTATEKAARLIDRRFGCGRTDSLRANRTLVLVSHTCDKPHSVTVRLVTRVAEENFLCDFTLVRGESDLRKAQRTMLDFANYLAR